MRFFVNNKGMTVPFKIVQGDGTTAKNLTSITCRLYVTDRDGNAATGSPITGTVTDAANGLVEFVIPSGMFPTVETEYKGQINLTGTEYEEDTEFFTIDIDKSAKTPS